MNDTHTIIVRLPADRDYTGTLELQDAKSRRVAGPFEVCGRADDALARQHRNPTRNPLLPHGDMPLGEYRAKPDGAVDEVELEPRNGDAALADANGRFRFVIQGGGLRPIGDGLRMADVDLRELARALARLQGQTCTCLVLKTDAGRNKVALAKPAPASVRRETPPQAPASTPAPIMMSRAPRRSRLLMVFWLRALMGATGALVAMRSAVGSIAASPPSDPSGGLRSAISARGSSTSPIKPRFAPGRLFARMGGDYTQPEEETPAQQPPSEPAPEESAPTQAPSDTEEQQNSTDEEQQAPAEQEQQAPAEQEQQAPAEQEQQSPAEQEQQAPAEQEQQAPAEQEQQAPAEQEQQAPAEQEQQAPAEQEQQAPAEQEQQAPAEQEQQAPAEQEQQAPAEQAQPEQAQPQEAPAPVEPGGDTNAMDQLKNAEQKSQEGANNPSLEGAHEDASQPFDKGVQVPLTPFQQGVQPGQAGLSDQKPEQQAPQRSEPAEPQSAPAQQAPAEQAPAQQDEEDEEETPAQESEQEEEPAPQVESPSAPVYSAPTPGYSAPAPGPAPAYQVPAYQAPAPAVPQRGNLYVDPASFQQYLQPMPVQKTPPYDPKKLDAQIKGIKDALDRLKTVSAANLARSAEWVKASNAATKDAMEEGKNLTVDLLVARLSTHAATLDKEMQGQVDKIINTSNPAEKKALQDAFLANAEHKEQLQKTFERLEYAHKGTDVLDIVDKNYHPADSGEEQTTREKVNKGLENASDVLQLVAPGGTSLIKSYVDAGYDIWVQADAVEQVNSANQGQTEYLNAVNVLTKRMQTLVDLKKKYGLPPSAGD